MAYAALVSLEHTTDLLLDPDNYSIPVAVIEEIRSIRDYVMVLTSFLEDFPATASCLEAKIREIANDTEAIIEDFMEKQHRKQHRNLIEPSRSDLLPQFRKEAEAIGSLVSEVMDGRAVGNSVSFVSSARAAITSQKDVAVGLDDDLFTIKDRLCRESSKLQVVPIVGMGGIGKTTLARNAYEDPLIAYHFHIRVWVTISQDYSPRNILLTLIDSMRFFIDEFVLKKKTCEEMVVYQTLKGRKYLIVMDDVWSTKVWDDLRNIFPDDGNGSRIILTTRLSYVAAYPDSHSPLHKMELMDDHQSWDLFQQRVGSFPFELKDIGKRIARRCAGLPLAVVLVAGVLSQGDMTPSSWEEIARIGNPAVEMELGAILSLSYTHLAHHLRPCLLFIGSLPEDKNIRASNIIRLWVAESFLKHRDKCSLEEVAEEYLDDLVKRNLVIVKSRKIDGKIKRCSVHDMVRDLCIRKASEERFICVFPQGLMSDQRIILSGLDDINNILGRDDVNNICGPTIRTILCFKSQNFHSWAAFLGRSRFLRVLHGVSHNSNNELPVQVISELFHLRYLVLYNFTKIPSSICNLVNLQTLIIVTRRDSGREPDFSLPLEVWRMRQLRHLILNVPHVLPPPPNSDGAKLPLQNLQTLSNAWVLAWDENIMHMIPNVKKLGLVCTHDCDLFHPNYLRQLEKLKVVGYSWHGKNPSFPRTLKNLCLEGGRFPWKDIAIISSLPNLQVLKLTMACDGETWETTCEEFPQLLSLLIEEHSLMEWKIERNSFPRLRFLALRSCRNLREIPEAIGDIPTLELIELINCQKSVAESAMKIKEDQESYGSDSFQVSVKVGSK